MKGAIRSVSSVPIASFPALFLIFISTNTISNCIAHSVSPSRFLSTPPQNIWGPSFPSVVPGSGLQFRQREVLKASTNTGLEWEVNRAKNYITFNFKTSLPEDFSENTAVLLGLSRSGHVQNSDVVAIEGVGSSQWPTLTDMYGSSNKTVSPDSVQNWKLENFQRNYTTILMTISRRLDTCDAQDILINNDLLRIIWGFSNSALSDGSIVFEPEGNVRAYLTDPMVPTNQAANAVQSWRVSRKFQIPPRHTSYWCTIHRGPQLSQKHHITRFAPYFRDDTSRQHIHHQLVYRCLAPPGFDPAPFFEKFVDHPGEECYLEANHDLPTIFCTEIVSTWGVGGNAFNLPNDIGFSLGETKNEYFMYESHYDNPESRSDLVVDTGFDFEYTSKLRTNEGGIIFVGSSVLGLYQIPPNAQDFTVAGHCSPDCTRQMFPPEGTEIVATMLHAHMATHSVVLKNFRGNREQPWIQSDNNYDFSFQQMRLLPQPVTVFQGDQLASECRMTTTNRNSTTVSGFSTRDEMCVTFFVVKKNLPFLYCSSEYPTERTMARYGIRNMTWNREGQERIVNAANNQHYEGQTLVQVMDQSVSTWTPEMIRDLEREQLYSQHSAVCPPVRSMGYLAYALLFVQGLTKGLINGSARLSASAPSVTSISTPGESFINRTAHYPFKAAKYIPPGTCYKTL